MNNLIITCNGFSLRKYDALADPDGAINQLHDVKPRRFFGSVLLYLESDTPFLLFYFPIPLNLSLFTLELHSI